MLCAIEITKNKVAGTDENEFGVWNVWHTSQKKQTKFESFKQALDMKWAKKIENEVENIIVKDHLFINLNLSIFECAPA